MLRLGQLSGRWGENKPQKTGSPDKDNRRADVSPTRDNRKPIHLFASFCSSTVNICETRTALHKKGVRPLRIAFSNSELHDRGGQTPFLSKADGNSTKPSARLQVRRQIRRRSRRKSSTTQTAGKWSERLPFQDLRAAQPARSNSNGRSTRYHRNCRDRHEQAVLTHFLPVPITLPAMDGGAFSGLHFSSVFTSVWETNHG